MKHTPGPWTLETVPTQIGICHKIGPFPSNGVYETTHACVYSNNTRMSDLGHSTVGDELLANARLIAAAPEMLDTMWAVANHFQDDNSQPMKQLRTLLNRMKGELK